MIQFQITWSDRHNFVCVYKISRVRVANVAENSMRCRRLGLRTHMMTSSNGNIFRVTGHLCGEFTGPRWIPRTKASDAESLMFSLIFVWVNDWVNNREVGDLRRYRVHCDVIVRKFRLWNIFHHKTMGHSRYTTISPGHHVGCWCPSAEWAPDHQQPTWWLSRLRL